MGKKEVPDRRYTDEFKVEAVRLGESIGINRAAKRSLTRTDAGTPPRAVISEETLIV